MDCYRRTHLISQNAIDRLRDLVPQVIHRCDTDIGNAIDEAVVDAMNMPGRIEQWRDEMQPDGRNTLWSLELEVHNFGANEDRRLYALLRAPEEGGEQKVVMTVLPRDIYLRNVEGGRWKRPAVRRQRRGDSGASSPPTLAHRPFEALGDIGVEAVEPEDEEEAEEEDTEEAHEEQYLVLVDEAELAVAGDHPAREFHRVAKVDLAAKIAALVTEEGFDTDCISVWRRTSIRPKVRVEVDLEE